MSQASETDEDAPQLYLGMFTSGELYGVRQFACVSLTIYVFFQNYIS